MTEPSLATLAAVMGVHHVQLSYPAHLQAQIERFYGQLLGLPRVAGSPCAPARVLRYMAGSQRLDLVPRTAASHACECQGHLALRVAGLDALHQRLLAHGATALAVVQVHEGMRFYAKDPAGNTLELLQPAVTEISLPWAVWPQGVPVETAEKAVALG